MENEVKETKFKVGQLATHKLGFKCIIAKVYTEAKVKETEETTPLDIPVYVIQFLAANGGLTEAHISEDLLDEYVA